MPGYRTWSTNDVISAADMNELHADPLVADVVTDETRTTASYGDLSTSGPAVTKTLVNGQKVLVYVACRFLCAIDGATAYMGFAVSGATTLAASDANGGYIFVVKSGVNGAGTTDRWSVFTATASGSHTFTAKYKGDGSNLMHFIDRRIIIKPH